MDYFEVQDRYRKRALWGTLKALFFLFMFGLCLWLGWFVGYSERSIMTTRTTDELRSLQQDNEKLQQKLSSLREDLVSERHQRREAELLLSQSVAEATSGDSYGALRGDIARLLDRGLSEDEIRLVLSPLSESVSCTPLEEREVSVATGVFSGSQASASFFSGGMKVFVEGEALAEEGSGIFDESQPVSLRATYLGGEKVITSVLPFELSVIADSWLIKIESSVASLKGFVRLKASKCSIE